MNTFVGILGTIAFIALSGLALVANESAAISGQYAQTDQFLYSIVSR